jgi:Pyridoxamine 5'-phosphate oxidase
VHETPQELEVLQGVLDESARNAGPHMSSIITADRRLSAAEVCEKMQGLCLIVVATVTARGRPVVGPVDGFLVHGSLCFSSGKGSVRMKHLMKRDGVSASYLPHEKLAITFHGRAELFELSDRAHGLALRQAMLDHYLPLQGPSFQEWLDNSDAMGARIEASRVFTFHMED